MKDRILIVDDETNVLAGIQRHWRGDFDLAVAESGVAALKILAEGDPFAVVVSDYSMPGMSGTDFLAKVRGLAPDTVRVMLTGHGDLKVAIQAINENHIFRFLTKPCSAEDLGRTLHAAADQHRLITAERELLEKTLNASVKVLTEILSVVSPVSFSRSTRIREIARKIAVKMGVEKPWEVEAAAMLSHIGFVTIPGETLEKIYHGRQLSEKEQRMFDEHPMHGSKLLRSIPRLENVAEGVLYQEKRFDGSGFPRDLKKGRNIPLAARILKVLLDFDLHMTTGKTAEQALIAMIQNAKAYDADVLSTLNNLYLNAAYGGLEKLMLITDLKPGLILARDVRTTNGQLLLTKDLEITDVILQRLANFYDSGNLEGAVPVREILKK